MDLREPGCVLRAALPSELVHVLSLAQFAALYTRSWAVDSMNGRVRLKADNDRLLQELDHFARRSMGFAVFDREPDAVSIGCFFGPDNASSRHATPPPQR